MTLNRRLQIVSAAIALAASALPTRAEMADKAKPLTEDQKVRHVLDRLGFGPRPGDIARVRAMGINHYIDLQLHPDRLPDDHIVLASMSTLTMSAGDMLATYRQGMMQARELARQRAKQQESADPAKTNDAAPPAPDRATLRNVAKYRAFAARVVGELQMAKAIRAVDSDRQLLEVMVDFWGNHFNIDVRKNVDRVLKTSDDREVIRPHALGKFRDLLEASAKSPAMLVYLDNFRSSTPNPRGRGRGGINENYAREIMELHTLGVDGGYTQKDVQEVARCFTGWSIDPQTGAFRFYPRRHDDGEKVVLGHDIPAGGGIRDGETVLDILASSPATAHHISYELCQRFVADKPPTSLVNKAAKTFKETDGDIAAVVRTIVTSPEFFSPEAYRAKVKSPFEYAVSAVRALDGHIVLGRGDAPAAARRLQVAENMAQMQALSVGTTSFDQSATKNPRGPLGRMRAYGGRTLVGQVAMMGQPLFQYQAPTGYPEDSSRWVSAGALIARLNFALSLTRGRIADVQLPHGVVTLASDSPDAALDRLEKQVLHGEVSEATKRTLLKETKQQDRPDPAMLAALVLGSPEFQRR